MKRGCARLFRLGFFLLTICSSSFAQRSEAEKVIASSHIAVVKVSELLERDEEGQRFRATPRLDGRIKGELGLGPLEVVVRNYGANKNAPLLFEVGKTYLIFCHEIVTDRGNVLYAENEETLSFGAKPDKAVIERLARRSFEQIETIRKKFQSDAVRHSPFAEKIDGAIALLFDRERQQDAITQLLALPKEADAELIWRVYDTRRIPRNLVVFKPNAQGMTFHVDPIDECSHVQEAVLGVLRRRVFDRGEFSVYGWIQSNDSTASRDAVADTWFYVIACGRDFRKE